jgi:hypothetical protein
MRIIGRGDREVIKGQGNRKTTTGTGLTIDRKFTAEGGGAFADALQAKPRGILIGVESLTIILDR